MPRLQSTLDTNSETYRQFYAHNKARIGRFREMQNAARWQRPERDIERLARQGKMFARDPRRETARPRDAVSRVFLPGRQHGV